MGAAPIETAMANSETPDAVQGVAASGGIYRGPVRVIGCADDLSGMVLGDILVAQTARPEYATALRYAGGLLVGGGMLSNLVTVARELGVPTVLAPPEAFRAFVTGDDLLLDGNSGVVQRLHEALRG